ncbi:MAG: hypothetical protein HY287_18395 [Planctomycetes bacterium]|nr:hypothetical protein [Planctomycetota bacterium]
MELTAHPRRLVSPSIPRSQRRTGTQVREAESGFRYTPTTCFETFPLPRPPGKEPAKHHGYKRIAKAARELNEQRERWLNPPEWIEPIAKAVDRDDDFPDVPQEARALIRQSAIMAEVYSAAAGWGNGLLRGD